MSGSEAGSPRGYLTEAEHALGARFLSDGHVILPAEDAAGLDEIRKLVAGLAARHLGRPEPNDPGAFLDGIHELVAPADLNGLRLAVIEGMNTTPWFRETYYGLARGALASLAGNELAMQMRVSLSIQLPGDDSSLLPLHSDAWSGVSAFEIVAWLPLVDCYKTKSMYLLPPERDRAMQARMHEFEGLGVEDLFKAVEGEVRWLEVPYGRVLLFGPNLMHGNRVNRESTTRWSMNCRFKSLLSPYADKKLGEYFEPITLRPVTRWGMSYRLPEGFSE